MISKILLPHKFKIIGWFFLIPSLTLGILWVAGFRYEIISPVFALLADNGENFTIIYKNIFNEIVAVPLLISLIFVAFAKEKNEDEYLTRIRLESLSWSILINSTLLLIAWIIVFREGFYNIMVYNMFTVLILYIIRFYGIMYINKKQFNNEK